MRQEKESFFLALLSLFEASIALLLSKAMTNCRCNRSLCVLNYVIIEQARRTDVCLPFRSNDVLIVSMLQGKNHNLSLILTQVKMRPSGINHWRILVGEITMENVPVTVV